MHRLFHYTIGAGVGLGSVVALALVHQVPRVWFFAFVLLVWIGALIGCFFFFRPRARWSYETLILSVCIAVSCTGLVLIVEQALMHWFLTLFGGFLMALLFGWAALEADDTGFVYKRMRRFLLMVWTFVAYALTTIFFGFASFFPSGLLFFVWNIINGLFLGYISYMIWRMYFEATVRRFFLWALLIAFVVIELAWVIHLLPFGYLSASVLVVWVWYLLQLLARFHFSERGIEWRKQLWFLVSNGILYFGVLFFFIRWI